MDALSYSLGRSLQIDTVSAWRLPELTLEYAIESCFRFVSDAGTFIPATFMRVTVNL